MYAIRSYYATDPEVASVDSISGIVTALSVGSTTITVTTADGLHSASIPVTVTRIESLTDKSSFDKLNLYPNPCSEFITVTGINSGDYRIQIRTIQGAEVLNNDQYISGQITIDTYSLQDGTYIMQISNSRESRSMMFSKIQN